LSSLKRLTAKGVFWSSVERFSAQGIQFVLGLILARILSPSEYGIIGMLSIFIAVAQSFIDSGFSNALIRKKDRNEVDYSTVFYFNIIVGIVAYFILFFLAPLIANFYETPILSQLTKVVALNVFINSLAIVQRAKLTITVDFKTQAKATTLSVILSGILGIYLAYTGLGVWALAIQSVSRNFINVLLLWILSKWKPKRIFSMSSFREMFDYGYKLLISGLIDTLYRNIYSLVIGKVFSANDLGNYSRAQQFANFPSSNITGVIGRVTFPIMSKIQDDDERLSNTYRKYLRLTAFIVFPLMMGLAALARPMIIFILTEKWEATIILLQILCFSMMLYPIHAINLNLIQVKGRSDWFLKLEIIKKIVGVSILCITIPMGLVAMVVGGIFTSIICLGINTHYTGKLINLGFWKQMLDLAPIFLISVMMGAVVSLSVYFVTINLLKLIIGIIVGIIFYFLSAKILKMKELDDLMSLIKKN
jgi:O-antigen/teichoic acid export membrane protein